MRRRLCTLACAVGVATLAGCGGSDDEFEPLPAGDAEALITQLDQVEERCEAGQTGSARFQVRELQDKVDGLPDGVDPDLREALLDGIDRLAQLVEADCSEDEPEEETDTRTVETAPPETETAPPETEPETEPETTPPQTQPEPEPTTPPETEPPPPPLDEGGGAPGPDAGSGNARGRRGAG